MGEDNQSSGLGETRGGGPKGYFGFSGWAAVGCIQEELSQGRAVDFVADKKWSGRGLLWSVGGIPDLYRDRSSTDQHRVRDCSRSVGSPLTPRRGLGL
jgi:hypothetical protein